MKKLSFISWFGILYTYVINTLGAILMFGYAFDLITTINAWIWPFWFVVGLFNLFVILIVFLYHIGVIQSKVVPGILATVSNLFGGVMILAGGKKEIIGGKNLESELNEIKQLLDKGILTEEEYKIRRETIIKS
jgi:hypothetical protein